MKGLRKVIGLLLLLTVVSAQPSAVARQADEVSDLWLQRARSLADELVKDADALGQHDRALLWARLGMAWQRDDAERARAWVEKAVQAVESIADEENATEYDQRLNAARSLLVMLGARDKVLSARLDKVITAAAEATAASGAGRENAHAKAEAGLAVLDRDPQRASQFGLAALRAGGSYKLARLLWRLRQRDVKLSDSLFAEILAAARAKDYAPDLLGVLPGVAFEGPVPSDKLRASFLGVLAEGLLRAPNSAQEQSAICRLASIAAPLLPEFQRLLPQQAVVVRAQVAGCQATLAPLARKEVGDALQGQPLNTVEALLEAAGKTPDLGLRATYRSRAAYMAFGEQRYERALNILDGFRTEERELINRTTGGTWDSWRADFAAEAAVAHLRRGDRPAMYQVITDTPEHLRASVRISVARELAKKDGPAAAQLLDEVRASLGKAGSPQGFDVYLSLSRLYAVVRPPDALPALRAAIKAMNEAERAGPAGTTADAAEAQMPLLSHDLLLMRYTVPASLLELDETGVRQAVASVDSPARRAAMRLRLLGAALAQRRETSPKAAAGVKGQSHANQ